MSGETIRPIGKGVEYFLARLVRDGRLIMSIASATSFELIRIAQRIADAEGLPVIITGIDADGAALTDLIIHPRHITQFIAHELRSL